MRNAGCNSSGGLKIGEVARRFGLNVRTLRYYEDMGLLSASRTESGYRAYSEGDVEQLRFVLQAKQAGFSLEEIAEVLRLGRRGNACAYVRETLAHRIAKLDMQIAALQNLRASLTALQTTFETMPEAYVPVGRFCWLIEGMDGEKQPPALISTPLLTREEYAEMASGTGAGAGKRQVEVFVAGCPLCEPVVELVKQIAGDACEVRVHNIKDDPQAAQRAKTAGVERIPMVLVDGQPAACCSANAPVTEEGLRAAGIGVH